MRLRAIPATLLFATVLAPVAADIVYLKNGKTIEGKVTKDPIKGQYRIETPRGTVFKPIGDVDRVEEAPLPADVFESRFAKIAGDDLEALAELAAWAREKRLVAETRRVAKRILEIDPNHEMARRELGYTVFENEWILEKELRRKQQELGLVKFRGEWMSTGERDRRVFEEMRQEVGRLFESVRSDNTIVLDYAVRRILSYGGTRPYDVFLPYLTDPDENVRLVAVSALSRFPAGEDQAATRESPALRATRELYRLALQEPSAKVVKVLRVCLRRFHPSETFQLALETLQDTRAAADATRRAGEIAELLLLKSRVPALCEAVAGTEDGARVEHVPVRDLLKRVLGVDHGFDPDAWLSWWKRNEHRFRDVP